MVGKKACSDKEKGKCPQGAKPSGIDGLTTVVAGLLVLVGFIGRPNILNFP
jgi:hypothetical protein